jgi:hypothetical protein
MKYLLVVLFFILSVTKVQAQECTATWAAYIQWVVWHENLESSDVGSGSPYPKQYFSGYPEDLGKGLYGWTEDYEYSDDGSKFLVFVDHFILIRLGS